jgi:dipeptidyl-peptidase-4
VENKFDESRCLIGEMKKLALSYKPLHFRLAMRNTLNGIMIKLICITFLISSTVFGQVKHEPEVVTAADYARAENFLSASTNPKIFKSSVRPEWADNHRFWYKNTLAEGAEYVLVDAEKKKRQPAFDHEKLAKALGKESGVTVDPTKLRLSALSFDDNGDVSGFTSMGKNYTYNPKKNSCKEVGRSRPSSRGASISPDGHWKAFIKDHNLWIKNQSSGEEKQLTTDGQEDFGYATNNAGWTRSNGPVLLWSPDSKKIATFQHDGRGVGEMYLATTNVGHPKLQAWKYPLPEDSVIFRVERVVIHVDEPRVVRLQMAPDQHRSTVTDHIATRGGQFADVEWSADASSLSFVSVSRDHKHVIFRVANPETGEVREVLEERSDTFFESGYNMVNWHYLPESNEVLWFSQRDNWGHLYTYDLTTGAFKQQLTKGDWNVLQVLEIDEANRTLYFVGAGREAGDPYFHYLYKVNMDGSGLKLLTPDSANHRITLSPDATYFIDNYSTPQVPPVTDLRDQGGSLLLTLEEADVSELMESGWVAPVSVVVKARDGETNLYGLMYKPSNFDPEKRYPIINYIYPGPQSGSVRGRSFSGARGDNQALAELGFVVVAIDAMGTPMRSKSFHAAYYGNMGDNGLPDQIAGMKQLAERHPWIDLDRAGIYGHSGGGYASTDAILRYPDFFKVAVSGAGNHDNRNYEDAWGEKWQGLLEENPDGTTNYDNQANQDLAKNLKGKLLLAHGTMDGNVPMYNTLLVVNELIAANKDFDLILFPNRSHGFGNEPYMMRRRWDYFVKHLLGAEPPEDYEFKVNTSRR